MATNNNISNKAQPPVKISFGDPKQLTQADLSLDERQRKQLAAQERQRAREQKQQDRQRDISKVSNKSRQAFGLKEGQTTATGLEKAIFIAGDAILKAQFAVDGIFYGKFEGVKEGAKLNEVKQLIDKGIVNVLNQLSEIDLCQILNYLSQKSPGAKSFDPNSPPPVGTASYAKWKLQKKAFDTQLKIDNFYSSYSEDEDNETKAKNVYSLITEIKQTFNEIGQVGSTESINDPRIIESYPQIEEVNAFFEKSFAKFNTYEDPRQIPIEDIQKLINSVDKIRAYLILIQSLNNPAGAIAFVDSVFPNANIQEQIQRLERLIVNPDKIGRTLNEVVKILKKIQSWCNVFASFITTAQGIIRIVTLIVKVFKILAKFLKKLPIPAMTLPTGAIITWADFVQNNIVANVNKLLDRLNQINTLLSLCVGLLSNIIGVLYDMIAKINRMLVNLENCSNVDPNLINELQNARDELEKTTEFFEKFVDGYNSKKQIENATFGDFTISIVTEEIVDDSINLRRRYGIAQAKNNTIVAQSTPTFASDNQIIINEVKFILATQGFVKSEISLLNANELATITESLNYLIDENISLSDLEIDNFDNGLDPSNNEDENNGLGLNAFINKLQGGKKLKERMRKMMIQNSQQLQKDLKSQDPAGKYTSNVVKQSQDQEKKLKLEQLNEDRKKLVAAAALTPNPIGKAILLTKIKDIDQEIAKLKKQ